ncbi:TetR/AcrR family transcriptional regulator [Streptomyces piniterrae]|uniref:TetR/AcrR family transcriptional regulator n=1 Tax=Streptomyces piniterrae TaxID=2571125 RepID=A0A4U0N8Z8_9ACTN|nr:TetR/AcrR family transcriptional regulator [Streptomyces piniterrae]TJZ50351.1 TetR/AcrR family transcriptional regulator [Streptomyces piniterrae]
MPDIKHFNPDVVLDDVVRVFWRQGMPTTGIQALVTATGVSRSSLYATFGNKDGLYAAALSRYIEQHSTPAFAQLSAAPSGLTSIEEFFAGLIHIRCHGEIAGWGCMVTNAHAGPECSDPTIRTLLDEHHRTLESALRAALATASHLGQLRPSVDLDTAAAVLATLAYGVNLRSRAGAEAETLTATVSAALAPLRARHRATPQEESPT